MNHCYIVQKLPPTNDIISIFKKFWVWPVLHSRFLHQGGRDCVTLVLQKKT